MNLVKVKASNDSEALAIAGRIIKDTVLRRDQVYVPGEGLRQKKEGLHPRLLQYSCLYSIITGSFS